MAVKYASEGAISNPQPPTSFIKHTHLPNYLLAPDNVITHTLSAYININTLRTLGVHIEQQNDGFCHQEVSTEAATSH